MNSFIRLEGVSKTYPKPDGSPNQVYRDFSLEIGAENRLVCLTGPDGAGKSTFLRLLAGLTAPDKGSVSLGERKPSSSDNAFTSQVGYMSQTLGLYLELTVLENLTLLSGLKGFDLGAGDRLAELLKKVDLYRFRDYPAGSLSGGMKQKLALTCALACSPKFLILDEPTVGVDPVSRAELWEIIFDYLKDGDCRCVFSTAYLEEAQRSDLVLMFSEGRIIKRGRADELVEECRSEAYALELDGPGTQNCARLLMFATRQYDALSPVLDVCPRVGRIELELTAGKTQAELEAYLRRVFPDSWQSLRVVRREPCLEDVYIKAASEGREQTLRAAPELSAARAADPAVVIDVKGIKKVFGGFTAVEHSDFQVHRGEIFGLLGPNGAGKTTTFRMICALLAPSEGRVLVNGFDLRTAKSSARATIGYVSQKFSLYRKLNCRQNLEYFGCSYGLSGRALRERVEELLEEFSLRKFADTRSESLPFGIQRQLSMACALIHKPKILFLDEATSGADPLARRNFWNRVNALSVSGTSIIVTTHFMEEAEYCDRFLIQDHGRILVLGRPDEICRAGGRRVSVEQTFVAEVRGFRQGLTEERA